MFEQREMEIMLMMCRIMKENMGDCPNIEWKTLGGNFFWETLNRKDGLYLQENYITGFCRIIDEDNVRIAWGNKNVMQEKFRRLTRPCFLEPGDVIGISRNSITKVYDHYAVYVGNNEVIHYAGNGSDFTEHITIRQASMDEFLRGDDNYFVLHFEDTRHAPKKIYRKSNLLNGDTYLVNQLIYTGTKPFELYSPEKTISRAKSRIGEDSYNLICNNCEHFALWCKTGVATSFQVKQVLYRLWNVQGTLPVRL